MPYWPGDAAFGVMAVLLGAVDAGLGACVLARSGARTSWRPRSASPRSGSSSAPSRSAAPTGGTTARRRSTARARPRPIASTGAGGEGPIAVPDPRAVREVARCLAPCRRPAERCGRSGKETLRTRDLASPQAADAAWRSVVTPCTASAEPFTHASTTRTASTAGRGSSPVQRRGRPERSSSSPSGRSMQTDGPTINLVDVGVTPDQTAGGREFFEKWYPHTERADRDQHRGRVHTWRSPPGPDRSCRPRATRSRSKRAVDIAFSTAVDRARRRPRAAAAVPWPELLRGVDARSSSPPRTGGTRWSCTPTSRSSTGCRRTRTRRHCTRLGKDGWATDREP